MSELDAVSDVEQITTHVPDGVALLPEQLRRGVTAFRGAWVSTASYARGDLVASGGTGWRALVAVASGGAAPSEGATWTAETGARVLVPGLLAALLSGVQDLEDAAFPLVAQTIATAETHALTGIGDLVGLRRADETTITDARYRVALRAWIRAMRSNGAIADFDEVLAHVLNGGTYTLEEFFPASLVITPDAAIAIPESFAAKILRATRAAGVGAQMITPPAGNAFAFASQDEDVEVDAARGLADTGQTQGGALCGVVE